MKEAQGVPANRCFGKNCHPEDQEQQEIKEVFIISASQRKKANRVISQLAERLRCSLPGLLAPLQMEVRRGNLSLFVYAILVQRVEEQGKRNVLSFDEKVALENAKAFLKESKQ